MVGKMSIPVEPQNGVNVVSESTGDNIRAIEARALDSKIGWVLGQVYALSVHCAVRNLGCDPITPEGRWFLSIVGILGEDATPSEVAKVMVRKINSVSGMLERMEEKGYIRKRRVRSGGKFKVRIVLTEAGGRVARWEDKTVRYPDILGSLSAEEKQELWRLLLKVRKQAAAESRVDEPVYPC